MTGGGAAGRPSCSAATLSTGGCADGPVTSKFRRPRRPNETRGASKTTRAYLHEEGTVRAAVEAAGFKLARTEMTGTNFYFSRLFEAVKA